MTPARALVLKIYHQHKGRYGYRRIRLACRNEGVLLNGKTVRKRKRKLTAVCSHQTRIGNLDAHLI
ncbi:transposase [Escherichia coli]|nr:transposase [Escherichia coli]EEY5671720.1 transposase [Escherichia coli]EFC4567465.1 transposase [Escherichia coli]EFC7693754.1 transposase [Escherichia coli]EFH7663827.1 IS3 family transposase [Escherichia coli]